MQGKVSIVVPCYNKEQYIGATLDSIIAQEWGNIELILINDGSTDGTRGVIASYEQKLRARGYEAVIVDQENAGACAAVKAGLDRITGEYMCLIDADDELDPKYVLTMAGWLEEHEEYDYCSCDYLTLRYENGVKHKNAFQSHLWPQESYTPEFFLCNDPSKAVWAFLARVSYTRKCGLTEIFYTDTRGSYEPSFLIPFTVFGGHMKHFDLPLYYYNDDVGGLSQDKDFEKKNIYWREYHRVVLLMLDRIPKNILDIYKKKYLAALSSFYTLRLLFLFSMQMKCDEAIIENLRNELLSYINNWLSVTPRISFDDICEYPTDVCRAAELALNGMWSSVAVPPTRIIGYGALGKSAKRLLPLLEGTAWQPTELWDKNGNDIIVKTPDFDSLNKSDAVLIFPIASEIIDEVKRNSEKKGARILYWNIIDNWNHIGNLFASIRFPQFEHVGLES